MDKEQQTVALAVRWIKEIEMPGDRDWLRMLKAVAQHDLGTLLRDLDQQAYARRKRVGL